MALFEAIIGNYGDDTNYSKIFDLDEYCSKDYEFFIKMFLNLDEEYEYLIRIQPINPININEQKVLENFS